MDCPLPTSYDCAFTIGVPVFGQNPTIVPSRDLFGRLWDTYQARVNEALRWRIDWISEKYRPRIDELRGLLETCDKWCIVWQVREFLRTGSSHGTTQIDTILRNPALTVARKTQDSKFISEMQGFLTKNPNLQVDLIQWYEKYETGNFSKRELANTLAPILWTIEQQIWVTFGFVPVRDGVITLVENKGKVYARKDGIISSGSSSSEALSAFGGENAIFQIIGSDGKVKWIVESPVSRALEALIFMDHHRDTWNTIAGWLDAWVQISYNNSWYKITLINTDYGVSRYISKGEQNMPWIWDIVWTHIGGWIKIWGWNSYLQVWWGLWDVGGVSIHWNWYADIRTQGRWGKIETAKVWVQQSLIFAWSDLYTGVGVRWVLASDLLMRDYRKIAWDTRQIFIGMKYRSIKVDAILANNGYSLWIKGDTPSWQLRFAIEQHNKKHALIGESTRWSLSYIQSF
jgi:hypothetical protein